MTLSIPESERTFATHAKRLLREWTSDKGDKVIVAFCLLVAAHIAYVFFDWGGEEYRTLISNTISAILYAGPFFVAFRTSRNPLLADRKRHAWLVIALANLSFGIAGAIWLYFENYLGEAPFPSIADAFFLCFYPVMMAGLLLSVEKLQTVEERIALFLDSCLILLGGGLVLWYFLLQPIAAGGDEDIVKTVLSLAYPVGDLVLLLGIASLLLRRRRFSINSPAGVLLAGVISLFFADFFFGYASLHGTYHSGSPVDALFSIACLCMMIAAQYENRLATAASATSGNSTTRTISVIWLPYVAVAAGYVILFLVEFGEAKIEGLDIIFATVMTTLVLIRQFVFIRENTRAALELTEVQHRIQGIYSATTDGIGVADFDGNLLEVNDALAGLLGYDRQELISNSVTISDITAEHDREASIEVAKKVIATQAPIEYEKEFIKKDGSAFTALVTVFPIRSPQGKPSAIAAIVRDITERTQSEKQLREAEERWQMALRVNRDGVWDWDLRNKKFYYSPRWREMFGFSPDGPIPFSLGSYENFFHPDERYLADETRKALMNSSSPYIDVEFRHLCFDNSYRWVRCRAEAVIDKATGRLARVVGLNTDISERKQRELETEAMGKILRSVSETSNLDELLSLVHDAIGSVIHARNCFIALHDKATDLFRMQFFLDEFDDFPASANLEQTRTDYVFRTGRALLLDEATTAKLEAEGRFRLVGTQPKYWLGVPLRTPKEIIGVLVVQSYDNEHSYSNHHLEFLNNVAGPIALAIERKRGESRMLLLNTALDTAANGIVITDSEGAIEWVNQAFSTLTGYSADEAKGTTHATLLRSGTHSDEFYADMWQTITTGNTWKGEITNRRKQGELYEEEMTITPVFDEASGTRHFIAIKSDITERKSAQDALRSSEEQHRLLFESNPFPVFVYDTETLKFLAVNEAAIAHYGYSRDEFLNGMTLSDIRPPEDTPELLARVAGVVDDKDTVAAPSRHLKKDGTVNQVEITSHIVTFAGRRAEIVLVNDITDRLAAEVQLRVFNQKLQQSNRELQEFAYIASHDLQEPLRKVQTFSDRLSSKYASALDETGLDYLERMRSAASRMQTLIQDLLSFSRVTTKAQPFTPVDLNELTTEVISDLEVKIEETGAVINFDGLPVIDADPSQMRQLVQNLIANAIKFRREDVTPVINICARRLLNGNSGNYQISVEDNGIGFDEKYLEKIFTVFQRLHGRAEFEGSGIGLAVCRKIVERHQGTITATSSPGHGAKFIFTLPAIQTNTESN